MIRFETEQTIGRSADDVWAYAADILRHPEWMGVLDARIVRGTGTEVGSTAIEHVKIGPRTIEAEFSVTEAIPAKRLRWTVAGRSPMRGDVTLSSNGWGRTRRAWCGRALWACVGSGVSSNH